MFHVGQKVVCVYSGRLLHKHTRAWPECIIEGGVYTIRELDSRAEELAIRLEEHRCESHNTCSGPWEPAFAARRFRPVVTTDIKVFTDMLVKVPASKVEA